MGDLVTTVNGPQAVTWIGRCSVEADKLADPEAASPMRVRKGALAENVPRRDLLITQEQALYVNGGLTPVRLLMNGRSIAPHRDSQPTIFHQVALNPHALLIAEGAVTESYFDTRNRSRAPGAAGPQPDFWSTETSPGPEYAAPARGGAGGGGGDLAGA